MKAWFSAVLFVCMGAHAADPLPELGRDKNAAGEVTGMEPRSAQSLIGSTTVRNTEELIDTSHLRAALAAVKPDMPFRTRGAREVEIYSRLASSVVLVIANSGVGSGSLISSDGAILTNWHVIRGAREVGVVFKPALEGRKLTPLDVRRAVVVRIDEVADLALLKVQGVPSKLRPILFATMADAKVGSDVHAIGHPTGEAWTYTKGFVSQVRQGYEWTTESGVNHMAEVIQTQTPINPGNSGGPLLSENGRMVGVNSFKAQGEGLNFAVSITEVLRFLAASQDRRAARAGAPQAPSRAAKDCEPTILKRSRNKENNADVTLIDLTCDGRWDAIYTEPDDQSKSISLQIDSKDTGRIDIVVYDTNRDGKWDISYHDVDGDGKPDLVGYHPDGNVKASRFETYVASR